MFFEPSSRRSGACLSELVLPERDPSAWARGWVRQCAIWMLVCYWMISVGLEMDVMMRNMYIMKYYVCLAWFMNCRWRVWYGLGMWNKWVGYYQRGMITRWVEILCAWMGYDELDWVGIWNMKGIGSKGWHNELYNCILFDYVTRFCLCQCVIPWGL